MSKPPARLTNPADLLEQAIRAATMAELAVQSGISLEAVVYDILKHDPDLKTIVQKHVDHAIRELIGALKRNQTDSGDADGGRPRTRSRRGSRPARRK